MKLCLSLVLAVAGAALAAPQLRPGSGAEIAILRLDSDVSPDGSFSYSYETANGIRAEARGQLVGPESQSVQGQFSFVADDGQTYSLQYLADENGYQPQGAHLPTPPPIPDAILKSLEFNRQHPEQEEGDAPRRQG